MDDEDIRHWQNLIAEHKRYLRIQEEKVAGFGKLNTPAHILKDIDDTSKSIAELEQRIRRRIRNAPDDGRLYNNEEVNEIYDLVSDIIRIEEEISFANLLIGSRESEEEP